MEWQVPCKTASLTSAPSNVPEALPQARPTSPAGCTLYYLGGSLVPSECCQRWKETAVVTATIRFNSSHANFPSDLSNQLPVTSQIPDVSPQSSLGQPNKTARIHLGLTPHNHRVEARPHLPLLICITSAVCTAPSLSSTDCVSLRLVLLSPQTIPGPQVLRLPTTSSFIEHSVPTHLSSHT